MSTAAGNGGVRGSSLAKRLEGDILTWDCKPGKDSLNRFLRIEGIGVKSMGEFSQWNGLLHTIPSPTQFRQK